MAKQKVTTKTSKRFRYSSFKAKIDDLKIEPARNLEKRAHDYVESSHFLASFEHWKDINLSAGFTEFTGEVENIIQTLPQIIYHEAQIFEALIKYIDRHEERSLQPLLDLLAQFCHDLGPDFMKFYETALSKLVSLLDASIEFESPNVFEWGFNCLAYIFKYLSRLLTENLIPTFDFLFPLLSHSKEYLSRFSAEALSFLIRKCKVANLKNFVRHAFKDLIASNESNLYDGLLTLFTEALISTPGSLHSKCKSILNVLVEESFAAENAEHTIPLLCDIWMQISRHASTENLAEPTICVLEQIKENSATYSVNSILKVLSTISYAESGKKITDWSELIRLIEGIIKTEEKDSIIPDNLGFLFCVILRNCDVKNLTQFHKLLFSYYSEAFPNEFLHFFASLIEVAPDRVLSFNGPKYLQTYIDSNWTNNAERIALFLLDIESKTSMKEKMKVNLPTSYLESTQAYLQSYDINDVYGIFWRVFLLKYTGQNCFQDVFPVLTRIVSMKTSDQGDFIQDVIGCIVGFISDNDDQHKQVFRFCLDNFACLQNSTYVIEGLNSLLEKVDQRADFTTILKNYPNVIAELTNNLLLPDSKMRLSTLNLLSILLQLDNVDIPRIVDECKIIEQIPLTLQNGRTITARLRSMGEEFTRTEPTDIVNNVFFKQLFGLLSVRFAPVWEGIREILPTIYKKNSVLVWELMLKCLTLNDTHFTLRYPDDVMENLICNPLWESEIPRLEGTLESFTNNWLRYSQLQNSFLQLSRDRRGCLEYPPHIRAETLKLLILVPQLAEKHSKAIVPFILKEDVSDEDSEVNSSDLLKKSSSATWQESERNLLLKVFTKFGDMRNVYESDRVFQRLLTLLGSRSVEAQRFSLDVLFGYKIPVLIKFRDNLKSLLDDTLFKDEIATLLSDNDSSIINDSERKELMVFVLRILFGRAQTPVTSGIKKSRKLAFVNVLPNLKEEFIVDFLRLGSEKFDSEYFFQNSYQIRNSEIRLGNLRRMTGFVTIVNMSLPVLGSKFPGATLSVVNPLLYCISMSYAAGSVPGEDKMMAKVTSNLRQNSLKALNSIFQFIANELSWKPHISSIFKIVIEPRLAVFANENLQQPSSLLKMIILWTTSKSLYPFLYHQNFGVVDALMQTLSNKHAKEQVVELILEGANNIIRNPSTDDEYVELVALIASNCLQTLPKLYERVSDSNVVSIAVELLLQMTELGYVQDDETKSYLLESLFFIVDSKFKNVSKSDIVKVLRIIATLLANFSCEWITIEPLYKSLSKLYQTFSDRDLRVGLTKVFENMAKQFPLIAPASKLLSDLNSYSDRRIHEYDFPRMLSAFERFSAQDYENFTDLQWIPLIHLCLFFVKNEDELALRTNATHCISKFVDYSNFKASDEEAVESIKLLRSVILPCIREGLKRYEDEIQGEYIDILAYIVTHANYYTNLSSMRLLLADGDDEANFFINVKHVQLHRRQRAIKRLGDHAAELSDDSIAHYLIPMIEHYVFSKEEKYRNIGNETVLTIGKLSQAVSWNQYKAILRRYISSMKSREGTLKEYVLLVNQLSLSLRESLVVRREGTEEPTLKNFPARIEEAEEFVKDELYPILCKILGTRNEETIIARIPLTEALVNFILGLPKDDTVSMLPGILTAVCQVLRSRSEELRDTVRTTLGKVSVSLGCVYLPFIIRELKSALQRGSQVHILSYTVHYILRSLSESLNHSDLDESARLLVSIIMENIFGAAGQEKESDNYHTTMKEVKSNKSYDTAEIVAANISLGIFNELLHPIRALLMERMNLKSQNKLDELLRRYSLGLNHNSEAASKEALSLCYEVFQQTREEPKSNFSHRLKKPVDEKDEFFLVDLNFKNTIIQVESSLYRTTLEKFSLDLLKTIITRHKELLNKSYLEGFIPLLKDAMASENEGVLSSALRVLVIFVKLEFSEESEALFKNCARKVLNLIKDSPTTSTELCQMGLKFLSSFIRHKDIKLKDTALSYVLGRILPDLNEPNKQGLAFNFLKALVTKHIMLPEIYDIIDNVREIMITNHSKEIRDVSRSVFYQFLMEYDQSKGRLQKQFKFMVDNLQYPSQEGRQSIMELLNLIITKANPDLLSKLSSSFFLSLSNVSFNDDSPRCREMAGILLSNMFKKLDETGLNFVTKYLTAWLKQGSNPLFTNLGLRTYKIFIGALGTKKNESVDDLALKRIQQIVNNVDVGSDSQWDIVYTALNVFNVVAETYDEVYGESFNEIWDGIVSCLLYPHTWVRQSASRLANLIVSSRDRFETPVTDIKLQMIASRVLRQLSAPAVSEGLSKVSINTLIQIATIWKDENTKFINTSSNNDEELGYESAIQYMAVKVGAIIRSEEHLADSLISKKSGIQIFALLIQLLTVDQVLSVAENIILALYVYLETDKRSVIEEHEELCDLAQECLQLLETKMSVADFSKTYSNVKQIVIKRRQERKAKRSVLAISAPDVAARRKIRKHVRSREKRKHEKDENGYYQRKNKKRRA